MKSGNPVLKSSAFERFDIHEPAAVMTAEGTAIKTGMLLILVVASAGITWQQFLNAGPAVMPWMIGGVIGGLVLAMITIFKPRWAAVTAPLYAVAEGLFLGGLSAMYEAAYHGIVFQAASLTFGTMFAMLVAYRLHLVRATEKFKAGVIAATGGICLVYVASILMGFFGIQIPGIFGSGLVGIGFSLFVVVIAALNLVLDFDFIEQGAARGAPKYMEWYGAFGLLVTLVWLYIEILRLLSKLNRR